MAGVARMGGARMSPWQRPGETGGTLIGSGGPENRASRAVSIGRRTARPRCASRRTMKQTGRPSVPAWRPEQTCCPTSAASAAVGISGTSDADRNLQKITETHRRGIASTRVCKRIGTSNARELARPTFGRSESRRPHAGRKTSACHLPVMGTAHSGPATATSQARTTSPGIPGGSEATSPRRGWS